MLVGANLLFRKSGIIEKWTWLNQARTCGKGSPFLSEEIGEFLRAIRRRELKTGPPPVVHQPYFSIDVTMCAKRTLCAAPDDLVPRLSGNLRQHLRG